MENSVTSSSSKVKVQYTDPAGIYPLIASDLNSKLPLRNLHWNSSSRPLRSIDSLYVELVPDASNALPVQRRAASTAGLPGTPDSSILARDSFDGRRGSEPFIAKKERRHQIPGLRQTSYLKVFLLRCDDVETYKTSSRKLLREWIKAHTPPTQSNTSVNNPENHDAFEWMIIHVVLPDVQNGSTWPNKSSLSVLDKVRTDFNGSSKSAVDRVAQIPATKSLQVGGTTVNPVPSGIAREQFFKESGRAWEELLSRVKSLILTSFDLRVRQYEEDIKAKSAQRILPGWNFCTFFVLKEGLARGFESVGLVEDALMGYDELSVELYAIIEDEKQKIAAGKEGTLFQEHTQELLVQAQSAIANARQESSKAQLSKRSNPSLLNADRKPYRDLILANNISAFDFESYVFARQVSLLIRIASISPASGTAAGSQESEDLMILAEICRRAVRFITSAGRTIREDLRASIKPEEGADEISLSVRYNVIENILASWTFSSCQQVLAITIPDSLVKQLQLLPHASAMSPRSSQQIMTSPSIQNAKPNPLPRPSRTTSLLGRPPSTTSSPSYDTSFLEDDGLYLQKSPLQGEALTGLSILGAQRAVLYTIAKRALSRLGLRRGWNVNWPTGGGKAEDKDENLDEVSLDGDSHQEHSTDVQVGHSVEETSSLFGVQNDMLLDALSSSKSFYSAYEDMTSAACQHYKVSGDRRSAEAMTIDLAVVRFNQDDYENAANYFHQLAPYYAEDAWTTLEISILDIYAQCLKKLERWDDFVRIAMKILAISGHIDQDTLGIKAYDSIDAAVYLEDLLAASKTSDGSTSTPMKDYFADIRVDPYLRHFKRKDGFELSLTLRYLVPASLEIEETRVRLISTSEAQTRDIWLSAEKPVKISKGLVRVMVVSKVMVPDWFIVDKITMRAGKITFMHDLSPTEGNKFFSKPRVSVSSEGFASMVPRILVWPPPRSLDTKVSLYSDIHLEEPRSLMCEISSGNNAIVLGKLQVRAASAGLRIHTANAELMQGDSSLSDLSQPGVICFEELAKNEAIKIKIPYRLDSEMKEISLRTETIYTTSEGEFVYGDSHVLSVLLPLGVNVHDVFKRDALFSKFSISSSTLVPLRLLDCHLEGTADFEASSPHMGIEGLCVFAKQPVSMVYRIAHKATANRSNAVQQTRLSMRIKYICLDEEALATVSECFVNALHESDFGEFSRLLLPLLNVTLRGRITNQDLELIGLLREVHIGTAQDFRWDQILVALPQPQRHGLASWLAQWHKDFPEIALPRNVTPKNVRTITIPVDVPKTQIVHTAHVRLCTSPPQTQGQPSAFAVGHSLAAELVLQHTRGWDTNRQGNQHGNDPHEFSYELDASPDTWLLGGRRRGLFSAKEHEILTFPILMIPQRAGHLMYPSLEVRSVYDSMKESPVMTSPQPGETDPLLTSELDYQNQGESILVVPNLSSTTVSVDPEGPTRGAWLLESHSRGEVLSG